MKDVRRTERSFWESYWNRRKQKSATAKRTLQVKELQKVFHFYLPVNQNWLALEIGGASSDFLSYFARFFNYKIHSLDYSTAGNDATRQKFKDLHTPIQIFEKDLFSDLSDLPKFELVYSLGFLEHFENPIPVIEKHLCLLKAGGMLMIGSPNLTGIYEKILSITAPSVKDSHNLKLMDLENWKIFEDHFDLEPIYKGYIGGFEPMNMKKIENKRFISIILYSIVTLLTIILSFHFSFLRKINSKSLSGYMIGIYKKK